MADDLAADVRALSTETGKLARSVQQLTTRATRSERGIIGVAIALALDILLTGAVVFTGYQVKTLADCVGRQYAATQESLAGRGAAGDKQVDSAIQQLQSQDNLFDTLQGAGTVAQREAAGVAYRRSLHEQIAALQALKASRTQNPLPDANSCG